MVDGRKAQRAGARRGEDRGCAVKEYVLDANALVRFFRNQDGAARFGACSASRQWSGSLRISVINLAEVLYIWRGTRRWKRAHGNAIEGPRKFSPSPDVSRLWPRANSIHIQTWLCRLFCGGACDADGATLVTADPEFARLGKQLKILALPRLPHDRAAEPVK